jgi:hypothetical protein
MPRRAPGRVAFMKVVRTRIVATLGSSAVLASCFGLTAFAVSSTSPGAAILAASQATSSQCPSTTSYDYCTRY